MKKLLLTFLAIGTALTAQAAISIGVSGSGTLTFDSAPGVTEISTRSLTGSDTTVGSVTALTDKINGPTNAASTINTALLDGAGGNPPGQNGLALWTSGGTAYITTRPTGNAVTEMMATLVNDTGSNVTALIISYDFTTAGTTRAEQVPSQQFFYSLTGDAGSWVRVPELSGLAAGAANFSVILPSSWANGSTMYVLWVDDNATGGTDQSWNIDNLVINAGVGAVPLSVTLTAPANGALLAGPLTVALSASTAGTTPATSVSFFTNGVLAGTDTTAPFSINVVLPIGTHTVQATASNGPENPSSATHTVTVRDEFVHYQGAFSENFDSLTELGTNTPLGWYVGGNLPANTMVVTPGDGSAGASGSILGWNYGNNSDRALGTAPTGADRNMVVRIKNESGGSMTAITIEYTGEVWRNYTNNGTANVDGWLTNYVSVDQGATWVATGFNFEQPAALWTTTMGAIDGNIDAVPQIGGTISLTSTPGLTPVPPNGSIYIRWHDFNGASVTDGGLAIDDFVFDATVETFTPTITIVAPTNGQQVAEGSTFTITAIPTFANPTTNVTFYDNNLSTVIGSDTNAPFSISASNLTVGAHTIFAVGADSTGVRATNSVSITVNPNQAPSVTFTNPPVITDVLVGTMVPIGVSATDPDGTITNVQFYVNGALWSTDTSSAYGFELNNIYAGANQIQAVAADNLGVRTTNGITITATNPPGVTVIVANGSQWNYLDTGVDQGTAWQTSTDNTGWLSGLGELGNGDGQGRPDRTLVNIGADGARHTVYFRKVVNVANPSSFSSFLLGVLADDAAVVYFNGTEVFRNTNLTANPVLFGTLAVDDAADDGTVYSFTNLPNTLLNAGDNVIAVEVHQNSLTSSDLSFDLMLGGTVGVAQPRITIARTSATEVTISWGADAAGLTLYGGPTVPYSSATWSAIGGVISGAGSTVVNSTTGNQFFMLRSQP